MSAGVAPTELYVDVMAPAMAAIGEGWAAGQVSVAEEHRASVVMLRLIGRLGPRFTRPGVTRGSIVLGAAPNDHHGVPVALAADLLRNEGFTVVDLGADSPAESFIDAARDTQRLVAVGINATSADNDDAIAATIAGIKQAAGLPRGPRRQRRGQRRGRPGVGRGPGDGSAADAIAAFSDLATGPRPRSRPEPEERSAWRRCDRRLPVEDPPYVLDAQLDHGRARRRRGRPQMRGQHDIVAPHQARVHQRLGLEHVEPCGGDRPVVQCGDEGRLVDRAHLGPC